jgi:geranylgeranyl reductase family protein
MIWDAVVVGAGPAGASAARVLASGGARVLLLDRQAFPRDKPCGGGVSSRVFPALPGPLPARVPFSPVDGTDLKWHRRWEIGIRAPGAGCVVRRVDFDAWLLDEAVRAGADFRARALPQALEPSGDHVRIRVRGEWESARRLIGCDGAVSWTARRIGARPRALVWAMDAVIPGAFIARPLFDFSFGRRGYAWAFRRPDGISVGVCSMRREGLRRSLDRFVTTLCRSSPIEAPRLWPAPMGMSAVEGWGGRVLLAGDAAGAVHPALGEGIRYAVWTGLQAAGSIMNGTDYVAWFGREMTPEFRAAARMRSFFYALPHALRTRLMTHPRALEALTAIFNGSRTCRDAMRAWKRLPALLSPGAK